MNGYEQRRCDFSKEEAGREIDTVMVSRETLPKYPLPSLEESIQLFLSSVSRIGTEDELRNTRQAAVDLLSEDGLGRRLQERLVRRANDPKLTSWHNELMANAIFLRVRNPHPRDHSFFCTLPLVDNAQAQQASLITLAAYEYKLSWDRGVVEIVHQDGQPLCMEAVRWLFNTNRTPALGHDRIDVWPNNDHVVAMREGHIFKVPLRLNEGQIISYQQLHEVFQEILDYDIPETNWLNILASGNRDDWAKVSHQPSIRKRDYDYI
jgi:hypothetical protein